METIPESTGLVVNGGGIRVTLRAETFAFFGHFRESFCL